jgi:hypothetical protein
MSVHQRTHKNDDAEIRRPIERHRYAVTLRRNGSGKIPPRANYDLTTIVAICIIAVLVALNVMLHWPDLGAVIAQYNHF